jgi:hypothetical protein
VFEVALGYLDYPGSGVSTLPAVAQAQPFTVSPVAEASTAKLRWDGPPRAWVLSANHPGILALITLSESEPELAAYNAVKLCLLGGALTTELDSRLLTLAMEQRCRRQEEDR